MPVQIGEILRLEGSALRVLRPQSLIVKIAAVKAVDGAGSTEVGACDSTGNLSYIPIKLYRCCTIILSTAISTCVSMHVHYVHFHKTSTFLVH